MDDKPMVTPEMLLFLAGKMGLPNPIISRYPGTEPRCYLRWADGLTNVFWPQNDRIQWADMVVWAAMNGMGPTIEDTYCAAFDNEVVHYKVAHDNTPDSIRAAAVVAICRALGWEAANVPE